MEIYYVYIYCCCLQKSKRICKIQNEPRDLLPDENSRNRVFFVRLITLTRRQKNAIHNISEYFIMELYEY